ncbi:MAG: Mrp/NBP35 family ATP-binding protein [Clostridia bacterium]
MIEKEVPKAETKINKIIAIMSGKGGVGKSSVTSLVALALKNEGYKVGIMDADITGPSIPKIFGINKKRATSKNDSIIPVETEKGIKIISLNLLISDENSPVIWRGPLIAGAVKQFYTDVNWGELDYLLIDLPPGTGDVALTIMQSLPLDGIIAVTSPQDLANLIVAKSINMAVMMNVEMLGIVENMSYFICPDCNSKHYIFGESHLDDIVKKENLDILYRLPINRNLVELSDAGKIENFSQKEADLFSNFSKNIVKKVKEL